MVTTERLFAGAEIGVSDANGQPITCGARVRVTERKEAYVETHGQDGWGRDLRLDRADRRIVPAQVNVWDGVVIYSPRFTAFRIRFDARWPDEDGVYMFKEIEVVRSQPPAQHQHQNEHEQHEPDPAAEECASGVEAGVPAVATAEHEDQNDEQ